MSQFQTFIHYLPVLTCIIGGGALILFSRRNKTIRVLSGLAIAAVLYYLCDAALFSPTTEPTMILLASMMRPCTSPFVLSFLLCYVWMLYYEKPLPWYECMWFFIPIACSSVCLALFYLATQENAEAFQYMYDHLRGFPPQYESRPVFYLMNILQKYVFMIMLAFYAIYAIGYCMFVLFKTGFTFRSLVDFCLRGSSLPPFHVILFSFCLLKIAVVIRIALGRYFMLDHEVINIVFSIEQVFCLLFIIFGAAASDYVECTLRQLLFLSSKENLDRITDEVDDLDGMDGNVAGIEGLEGEEDGEGEVVDNEAWRLVEERLQTGLQELMVEKKSFLNCDLRMGDVARQLCTNRNYLSRYVNEHYSINFSEYINRMRIDYSKEYMLRHPDFILDTVAVECGFGTAQSFGRKFKAIEGVTPRTWLVRQLRNE